jgi:hypothetical protein
MVCRRSLEVLPRIAKLIAIGLRHIKKETDMITSKPVELGTATEETKERGIEDFDNPQHTAGELPL